MNIKKILIWIITLALFFWIWFQNSFAAEWSSSVKVKTTVDFTNVIPWCDGSWCTITSWTQWVLNIMWWMIKYATFIIGLLAVLFIVINWILYSMSWVDQSAKDTAKKRIMKTLIWIIILLMSWTILNILAPWIYK